MEGLFFTFLGGGLSVLLILLYRRLFGVPGNAVHPDGATKERIDSSLSDARSGQQQATDIINRVAGEIGTVRENLSGAGTSVADILATLKRDRELIKRSREILEGLQKVDRKPTDGE